MAVAASKQTYDPLDMINVLATNHFGLVSPNMTAAICTGTKKPIQIKAASE